MNFVPALSGVNEIQSLHTVNFPVIHPVCSIYLSLTSDISRLL